MKADRPIAIRGLEKRLIRALDTVGCYGMLECYWRRCLLWQRARDRLWRLQKFRDEYVPSWSWMAYDGGIKYMNVPMGKVLWNEKVLSPFRENQDGDEIYNEEKRVPFEIEAEAWDINESDTERLILDEPGAAPVGPLKCVIIGIDKKETEASQTHYALLVSQTRKGDENMYTRRGVAFLKRVQIAFDRSSLNIRIR